MRVLKLGKFEHGFLSGFVSSLGGSAMMKYEGNMDMGAKVALSAALGGTAEALGGGKFANGAVTGAYVMMFNHLQENIQEKKLEKARAELTALLNQAIQESHDFYQNGGAYAETDNAFGIDFTLDGFTPNKYTQWLENTFEDIVISVGDVEMTVNIYMATVSDPSNPRFNVGVKFLPTGYASGQGNLPKGWNYDIRNNVPTRNEKSSTIMYINFSNNLDYNSFARYITW